MAAYLPLYLGLEETGIERMIIIEGFSTSSQHVHQQVCMSLHLQACLCPMRTSPGAAHV